MKRKVKKTGILDALKAVDARINLNFKENNLPLSASKNQTITLFKEDLERFRLGYQVLLEVLADILGVDYHKLCMLDLISYYYNKELTNGQRD